MRLLGLLALLSSLLDKEGIRQQYLTYGENADIPNKLSLFYNQAYETLFHRHDALKGGFKRDRNTKLDIQDFAKVFSAFSIQTYDQRLFDFSPSVAREYLSKAKKLTNIEFNEEEYLSDATQAVNLLVEDGVQLQFTHRSFQEYFTALFIKEADTDKQEKLIEKYFSQDNIISLLHEMKSELVEKLYLIPKLDNLKSMLGNKKKIGASDYIRFLKNELDSISIYDSKSLSISFQSWQSEQKYYRLIDFVLERYGSPLAEDDRLDETKTIVQEIAKKYGKADINVQIEISLLSPKHPIFVFLSKLEWFLSKKSLERVLQIRDLLLKKHQESNSSLEEILGI